MKFLTILVAPPSNPLTILVGSLLIGVATDKGLAWLIGIGIPAGFILAVLEVYISRKITHQRIKQNQRNPPTYDIGQPIVVNRDNELYDAYVIGRELDTDYYEVVIVSDDRIVITVAERDIVRR